MTNQHAILLTGFTCGMKRTMNTSPSGDSENSRLVALARDGDHEAFEELVEQYKQKAYRIAFGFARDREEAKDLSQDAFLKAFVNLKNFDGRSGFYTWFYRILVNVCLDYKRQQSRKVIEEFNESTEHQIEASHPSAASMPPDKTAMASQLSRKIGEALDTLPAKQRAAFILKNHEGLSIKEIAEVMQTAEGTVKVHLHRAVTTLRRCLAEFGREGP